MNITTIRAASRASIKVGDSFYTVEYCEERAVGPDDIIEKERSDLWNTCNGEVDSQIEDILKSFSKK